MAAEKHLKAVLISAKYKEIEKLSTLDEKINEVDTLAISYSHNFKKMIKDVDNLFKQKFNEKLLPKKFDTYNSELLVKTMNEGYKETRYPVQKSTARHYKFEQSENIYHDPLGSTFFHDFLVLICEKCWEYLAANKLNLNEILNRFEANYSENEDFGQFKQLYLSKFKKYLQVDTK